MRAVFLLALVILLAACGGPTSQAALTTLEGEWAGTITSVPYQATEAVNVSVGPKSGDTDLHPAVFEGFGTSLDRTVYCRSADLVEVECFRYGYNSWSISMHGTIQGRTWSGNFVFSDPVYGPDNGTFRFTKQ